MKITSGGISEVGDKRQSNQDSILFVHKKLEGHTAGLFLVADGIGGLSYGAEISNYIISEFKRWWEVDVPLIIAQKFTKSSDIDELLEQEIWDIHQNAKAFCRQTQKKSGSTLALLFILDHQFYIKNLGDSRIYRLRGKKLELLTNDQSTIQRFSSNGKIRYKNVLTMCIGIPDVPIADSRQGNIMNGDCYLLCSDGLYNYLELDTIQMILADQKLDVQKAADDMRKNIPLGHAGDNVSAVVIRIEK